MEVWQKLVVMFLDGICKVIISLEVAKVDTERRELVFTHGVQYKQDHLHLHLVQVHDIHLSQAWFLWRCLAARKKGLGSMPYPYAFGFAITCCCAIKENCPTFD